jgi:GNAT superfamily N-acetyltransferase
MTITPTVQDATPNQATLIADIVGEAFAELEVSRYLIPDGPHRRRMLTLHLHQMVQAASESGAVLTDEHRTAAAVWFDVPENGLPDPEGYEDNRHRFLGQYDERFAAFEHAMHQHHPIGIRYWHLALIAVRPSMQRRGMGSALLEHQHALLDKWRRPAYLEAADQESRRLYQRHGYLDNGDPFPCAAGGPLVYPMRRPPRTT